MGYVHPDKWGPREWREAFKTVGQMRRANWQGWVRCKNCGAWWDLNFARIELEKGAGFVLWGKRPKCKTMLCRARAYLVAHPPHRTRPFRMS